MATIQDPYDDTSKLSEQIGTEVTGGELRSLSLDEGTTVNYNGTSAYASATVANYRSGDSAGTLTAWIKADDAASTTSQTILGSYDTAGTSYQIAAFINDDTLWFVTTEAGTSNRVYAGTLSQGYIKSNTWNHVAVSSSGTAWKLYINGISYSITVSLGSNNGNWFADITNRDNVVTGARVRSSNDLYFGGEIDDVRVYSSQLTDDEVFALAHGIDPSASPVSHWKFNDGSGTATDDAGSDDLTLTNATWTTTHKPFFTQRARATSIQLI